MTPWERAVEREIRPLVLQAWEFRGTPYLRDAVTAIVDAYERLPLTLLERRQARNGSLVRLLSEIDPERIKARRR